MALMAESTLRHRKRYAARIEAEERALKMPRLRGHQPPAHLKPRQQAIWIELVKKVGKGVLTEADSLPLEQAVYLVEKMRAGKITSGENNTLVNIYSKLGCTPVDRCKIYTPQQPQRHANDWGLSA
jgi:hypothetical protein